MSLLIDKHPQKDFFIADIFDNINGIIKDDMASMEHPIFSLSKKKDLRNIEYKSSNISITIKPNTDGLPTIFDKDILLYCGSILMAEVNKGLMPPKTLRISCRDLLITTNRSTNDDGYKRLKMALDRLQGVSIRTNIRTNKREQISAFNIIEKYEIIESSRIKNRMVRLEITVSDWFYNSILGKEVLTINRDYFRLRKPMERRIYEIARKHCSTSTKWEIGLIKLMEKIGSKDTLRKFRLRIKQISKDNNIPDYSFTLDANDKVTFKQKEECIKYGIPYITQELARHIKGETVMRAKDIVTGTGWDFDAVIEQWSQHMEKNGLPDDVNGALIGFVKKKVTSR